MKIGTQIYKDFRIDMSNVKDYYLILCDSFGTIRRGKTLHQFEYNSIVHKDYSAGKLFWTFAKTNDVIEFKTIAGKFTIPVSRIPISEHYTSGLKLKDPQGTWTTKRPRISSIGVVKKQNRRSEVAEKSISNNCEELEL